VTRRAQRFVMALSFVAGCTGTPAANDAANGGAVLPDSGAPPLLVDGGHPPIDAGQPDTGSADAGHASGPVFEPPEQRPDLFDGPALLSEAGLYSDLAAGTLAAGVRPYEPLAQLWADTAEKARWLWLPEGTQIDTSDMDDWVFPVGTKAFKEFARDGVRIETRLVWKRGEGDWPMVAYLWNPEQTEAYAAPLGAIDAAGTAHDVPDATRCIECHQGRADRLLGPTALMLSHQGSGLKLADLSAEGRLSDPPVAPLVLPGDAATQQALGYLHANCGHCHDPERPNADRQISVYFWQRADALAMLEDTVTYRSLVTDKGSPLWIDAVLQRMADRGGPQQMPPLGTEAVDDAGLALVEALMAQLRADVPGLPPPVAGTGSCAGTEAVFQIFTDAGCRSSFCHGSEQGGLSFGSAEELHAAMVGVDASGEACADVGLKRVDPGAPEQSLLLLKLRPGPPCGKIMSPAESLTDAQIQTVSDWIAGCVQPGE
jgi:hypothetical protein